MRFNTAVALRDTAALAASAVGRTQNLTSGATGAANIDERDRLVEAHLALAGAIAGGILRSLPPSFELDDLVQAGRVGLLGAATRFRPEYGVPFSAYARKAIRGAILDHVAGRPAATLEVPLTEAVEPVSAPVIDIAIDRARRLERVRRAVERLEPGERRVIEMCRAGAPLSEAGEALGIDRRRAGELRSAAVGKLRRLVA
jgi:RNA polymerase sigma factor (sigma-70 family)